MTGFSFTLAPTTFETERVQDFLQSIGGYNIEVIEDRETATATSE